MSFSEWKEYRLKDLIVNHSSKRIPLSSRERDARKGKYPYYGAQGIIDGVDDYIFDGEYLLVAEDGNNLKERKADIAQIAKGRFWVNNHAHVLSSNSFSDIRFIKYFLNKIDLSGYITGTAQPKLNKGNLESIRITAPTLQEQKAIANILSSLDEKIELNNQMNKTLEEMAQALFKRWFVDFEFPNENGEPYKSSGGEMVDSELGMIPKGWEVSTLSDLCSLETKSEKPFENKEVVYEHFSLPACDEGKLPVIEMGSEISSNKYKIDNECILISKLNPSTKRIWNPTCTTKNAICSTEFMVYKPKKVDDKDFCYEIINSDRFTEFLLANVTGSTGSRQRTQPKKTLEYKIALGDRLIITKFSNMIKPMHELVKNNIESNKVLRAKRDTLLPKLMSGEIRVTDLQS